MCPQMKSLRTNACDFRFVAIVEKKLQNLSETNFLSFICSFSILKVIGVFLSLLFVGKTSFMVFHNRSGQLKFSRSSSFRYARFVLLISLFPSIVILIHKFQYMNMFCDSRAQYLTQCLGVSSFFT